MNKAELEQSLQSVEGFKKLFSGNLIKSLFAGSRARKSFEIWQRCPIKGVTEAEVLRKEEYEDKAENTGYYAVVAFSSEGELSEEVKQELRELVSKIDINTIRYECIGFLTRLQCYIVALGQRSGRFIHTIPQQNGYDNIYLFAVTASKKTIEQYSQVVYAIDTDNEVYVYLV